MKTKKIPKTFRIDTKLWNQIEKEIEKKSFNTNSEFVSKALENFLKEMEEEEKKALKSSD